MSDYPTHYGATGDGTTVRELRSEEMSQMIQDLLAERGSAQADLDEVLSGLLAEIDTKLADVTATIDRIEAA